MKIGVEIDTGGTYTDAVIYDIDNKKIIGSAKSLTTKEDLSIGILGAIDKLNQELLQKAQIISLSTTLATNACVEDKGGRAKLIFFGADKKVLNRNGEKYGLPDTQDIYIQDSFTNFSGDVERTPDWQLFENKVKTEFNNLDGVGIVEMNATKSGGKIEKKAKEIFKKNQKIPVICGHELFSEINSLQRASSTLLNAQLFPVIDEFLRSIKKSLLARNIDATLVIVRSDGSLMSEKFAATHPVETLLCGPAASTIGGTKLANSPNSIVVDMGGTTTDISMVKDNVPVRVTNGVSIGKWKTFVNGLYVKTFGLGGDSAIHYYGNELKLEEYRVIPICVAAQRYPIIIDNLKKILKKKRKHTMFLYEHVMLIKDISENPRYSKKEKDFCMLLKDNPLPISKAAEAVGEDIYTLNINQLIKDEVIQICGLTPTDIMHIKNDFNQYNTEASLLAVEFAAFNLDMNIEDFCDLVYKQVKRKLYLNIVKVMLENKYDDYMVNGVNSDVERFIINNFETVYSGNKDNLITTNIQTNYSLVGIGAPIDIFLKDVATMLGTTAIIPKHFEVANALGAVVGNISASYEIEIKPKSNSEGIEGYIVFGENGKKDFNELEKAQNYAVRQAENYAKKDAINRGAKGEITVSSVINANDAKAKDSTIYLGTTVIANAVGGLGL